MPYSLTFATGGRGLLFTGSGVLEASELFTEAKRRLEDPGRTSKLRHAVIDLQVVTELRVSARDLRRLAEVMLDVARLMPGAHLAFIAPANHVYGLIRMWQVYAEATGWSIEVFRERAQAEDWLRQQGVELVG